MKLLDLIEKDYVLIETYKVIYLAKRYNYSTKGGNNMILMGSHYWELNNENSDEDYISYSLPTSEDLFTGKLKSMQSKDSQGNDVVHKDIRMLLKELRKGSIISFQILYFDEYLGNTEVDKCLKVLREDRDNIYMEVKYSMARSAMGEYKGTASKLSKLNNTSDKVKIAKLSASCYKLKWITETIMSGGNPFKEWFKGDMLAQRECLNIKNSIENFNAGEYLKVLDEIDLPLKTEIFPTLDRHSKEIKDIIFRKILKKEFSKYD